MRLDEYERMTNEVAVYKDPIFYPYLGLIGETGEALDKLFPVQEEDGPAVPSGDVVKELGDMLFYIVRSCYHAKISIFDLADGVTGGLRCDTFEEMEFERIRAADRRSPYLQLAVHACWFAERLKKLIRDNKPLTRAHVFENAVRMILALCAVCERLGVKLDDVAAENHAKLLSRKERNTLQGDGDDR